MPTITGSTIIQSIQKMEVVNDRDYDLALTMIEAATCLLGDGEGADIGSNPEYERGVAEMICEAAAIPMDYKDDIILEIQHQAVLKREEALKRARVPF